MRISEYPAEELQEWLDLPATRGFLEELEAMNIEVRERYRTYSTGDMGIWKCQGIEQGIEEVIGCLNSLGEGL